ncbi:substrate-binding domain-containing protein [Gracilinema caldarium]|uniref:substrate-binding domain-containing protein n=1 Tax=Gracilinema caldarium TaxID=215591 RepID=UPI0026EB4461|nr:substrate-binding domain-containing protein [Gracilinema caldarium]
MGCKNNRRIGFLLANIHSGAALKLWPPLIDEVKKVSAELYLFPGGRLNATDPEETLKNTIYKYVATHVDGIISWASSLGGFVSMQELTNFHKKEFDSIPLVTMAHAIPGVPNVEIDAYHGMYPLLDHLYLKHGYKKIAYLQGPIEHKSAQDRFRAFKNYFIQKGIKLDERLISSPHAWNEGARAIEELIIERALIPGKDFDALVAASDMQLYDALQVLLERGVQIPQDIGIAGFNDSIESRIAVPSFTTVRLPFEEQALTAFRDLIKVLNGQKAVSDKILEGRLVIRNSCGCSLVNDVGKLSCFGTGFDNSETCENIDEQIEKAKKVIKLEIDGYFFGKDGPEIIADSFFVSVTKNTDVFFKEFSSILNVLIEKKYNIALWQDVISSIMYKTKNLLPETLRERAILLLDQARLIVADAVVRVQQMQQWMSEKQWTIIRDLEKSLINVQNRHEISTIVARWLPLLNISSAYIVEKRQKEDLYELIAGFGESTIFSFDKPLLCEQGELVPSSVFQSKPGTVWIVEPLCAKKTFLGWIVLSLGFPVGTIYEEIRVAVSNCILNLQAIDLIRKAQSQAETAEKIKSKFLENISIVFFRPLQQIAEITHDIEVSINGTFNKNIINKIKALKLLSVKQLLYSQDIIELAKTEAGDLELDTYLIPIKYILKEVSKNDAVKCIIVPQYDLPLLLVDPDKLKKIFAIIFNHYKISNVVYKIHRNYFICIFNVNKNESQILPALDPPLLLAQRLAAAHGGLLEYENRSDDYAFWLLKLPLPCSVGENADLNVKEGEIIYIKSDKEVKTVNELFSDIKNGIQFLSPVAIYSNLNALRNAAMIILDQDESKDTLVGVINNISNNPIAKNIPIVFLVRDEVRNKRVKNISNYFGKNVDAHKEYNIVIINQNASHLEKYMAISSNNEIINMLVLNSIEEINDYVNKGLKINAVMLFDINVMVISSIKKIFPVNFRPTIIGIFTHLIREQDLNCIKDENNIIVFNDGVYNNTELKSLLYEVVEGKKILSSYTNIIVKKSLYYLNEHLSQQIMRWKLADYVSVNEDYLTRIFKKELSISPWDYLIRLRITQSKHYLLTTSETIAQIASKTGFSDQAYFCRVFHKMVGVSPLVFRKSGSEGKSE